MKAILILAAVLLLVIAASHSNFAGSNASLENVPANAIPPVDISSSVGQSGEVGPEFKLVLLALRPEGFDTNEMHLEAGEYVFIIGNRTGLREVSIRLDREGKEQVAAATVGGRPRDWKQRLKLTPGSYVVTANDNPDWTCRIVVER
jgi:hypothetical protein